jgi:prevent-host-death family protein
MKKVPKREATGSLAEYVDALGDDPLVVTIRGRPVAALVSLENADAETVTLSTKPAFLRLIERSRRQHESRGGLSPAEMRRRLSNARNGKRSS